MWANLLIRDPIIDAIGRALEAFRHGDIHRTGCMIHEVIGAVDQGTPIITQEVAIESSDDLAALESRMHETEHALIVQGTRIALDRLSASQPI